MNTRGTHIYYRSFLDHFYSVVQSVGLERRGTHSLRHTFVKLAKKKGINPWLIKEMAGHKSIAVTMDIYGIDTDAEDLVKAASQLSGVYDFTKNGNTVTNDSAEDFAASIAASIESDLNETSFVNIGFLN
ncbi:MAG: tyrosine-type recombinase/integrase [Acidobacteria bacterium]|nr:tyrosine-type recombinase/integrase [Acidobacteriota bacterium]